MALVTDFTYSREDFKEYCLRKLGKPVVKINLDDQQIEDCVNDALRMYFDYHYDGVEERFIICPITDQHVTQGYIDLPTDVIGVVRILPLMSSGSVFDRGIFDINYQFHMSDFVGNYGLYQGWNLAYIEQSRMHQSLIQRMFNTEQSFMFNRNTNRVYLIGSLADIRNKHPDGTIVIHAYVRLDYEGSNAYNNIWSDRWLAKYTVALIKKQWGSVMKKFAGVQMLGGVTLDGKTIYDEAVEEIKELEDELKNELQLPPDSFMG